MGPVRAGPYCGGEMLWEWAMTARPVFNGLGKGIGGVLIAEHEWNYRAGTYAKHNEAQICTGMNISHTHGGAK